MNYLDDEKIISICNRLEKGTSIRTIAELEGVSRVTVRRYAKKENLLDEIKRLERKIRRQQDRLYGYNLEFQRNKEAFKLYYQHRVELERQVKTLTKQINNNQEVINLKAQVKYWIKKKASLEKELAKARLKIWHLENVAKPSNNIPAIVKNEAVKTSEEPVSTKILPDEAIKTIENKVNELKKIAEPLTVNRTFKVLKPIKCDSVNCKDCKRVFEVGCRFYHGDIW